MAGIKKKNKFGFAAFLIGVIVLEIFSFGGLCFVKYFKRMEYITKNFKLSRRQEQYIKDMLLDKIKYLNYDKDLGWNLKAHGKSGKFKANGQSIRAYKEYSQLPKEGILRIAAFGDSFAHCDEVANNETWQHFMEKKSPDMEVLNFGVSGYGLDQAYLRYLKEGRKFHPHIVFICFMQNDYFRHVNVFRPFYNNNTGVPLTKPRFTIVNKKLILIKNPIGTKEGLARIISREKQYFALLGQYDYYWQVLPEKSLFDIFASVRLVKILMKMYLANENFLYQDNIYNPDSEAFKLTEKIVDDFYAEVERNGSIPVIVVFPDKVALKLYGLLHKRLYDRLVEKWKDNGYNYIDLMGNFLLETAPDNINSLFATKGHYNRQGNSYVAGQLINYLQRKKLLE
ncbi:MAG: hypothetical protein A2Y03_04525 [Omnitrophica WOR_2 bacterium GWF2_38_59]|nr:MAG: hypothetical protein A2Y03_04525 [Omnitrophica WOR_2 bacterium GWF2_38_59]OGX49952.1 MAG: hypothetical protein A2243_11480 [Omnitrophica WOR_2 bacterium RIFOXYA2_FULL_38_17]OGX56535.1 MAG: hypothetical protein A2306_06915 [Omnitrophica WOR_2 bacterium RIFOXYB2_FULL_38_16]OGX58113.1 MAG: hypothetical protein A2447_01340 [Omnitrophica WOR_2 bacterium RIFOXYC2_FULL_38_12]HBG60767.1 hypothetical protein [Candidatus Omnitrophota bacterium]